MRIKCPLGHETPEASAIFKTGITENPSPTQELYLCLECGVLFVPKPENVVVHIK